VNNRVYPSRKRESEDSIFWSEKKKKRKLRDDISMAKAYQALNKIDN
jgi:hypothetical protein